MARMPEKSIDVIFADPPYFLQLEKQLRRPNESAVEGVDNSWDNFAGFPQYDEFTKEWLIQAKRLLKKNGTIWVMGSYHNIYRIGTAMQNLGFWLLNDIIWIKNNPMPNFRGRRFTNAHETILWCAKNKNSRYLFNYRALKQLNDEKQMRSDWYLPICSGKERIRTSDGKTLHPTQKPVALLYRIVLASTKVGDIILDPFCGSGTTASVCKSLDRRYIGIEREHEYIEAAKKRLANSTSGGTTDATALALHLHEPRAQARDIPFAALVENGLLSPGEKLESGCRQFQAMVTSDGTLAYQQRRASIHKMAAELAGRESCNGWTYWYYSGEKNAREEAGSGTNRKKKKTQRVPLDVLRQTLRTTLSQKQNDNSCTIDDERSSQKSYS